MINQSNNKTKMSIFFLKILKKIDNIFFFDLIKNFFKIYRVKKQKKNLRILLKI